MIQSRRKWILRTTRILSLLLSIVWLNHHSIVVMVVAMSASPIPFDVQLPDGSTITLVLDGDEFEHYERDLNGT